MGFSFYACACGSISEVMVLRLAALRAAGAPLIEMSNELYQESKQNKFPLLDHQLQSRNILT